MQAQRNSSTPKHNIIQQILSVIKFLIFEKRKISLIIRIIENTDIQLLYSLFIRLNCVSFPDVSFNSASVKSLCGTNFTILSILIRGSKTQELMREFIIPRKQRITASIHILFVRENISQPSTQNFSKAASTVPGIKFVNKLQTGIDDIIFSIYCIYLITVFH